MLHVSIKLSATILGSVRRHSKKINNVHGGKKKRDKTIKLDLNANLPRSKREFRLAGSRAVTLRRDVYATAQLPASLRGLTTGMNRL